MKKLSYLLILLILFSFKKKEKCLTWIYYSGFNIVFNSKMDKTMLKVNKEKFFKLSNDSTLGVLLIDCKGKSIVTIYKENKWLYKAYYSRDINIGYKEIIFYKKSISDFAEYDGEIVIPVKDSAVWNGQE